MRYLIIILLTIIAIGCAAKPIYKFEPVDEKNTEWYDGREISTRTSDSIETALNFEEHLDEILTFYVYAKNNFIKPIVISADNINLKTYSSYENFKKDSLFRSRDAINPDIQLEKIKNDIAKAEARITTCAILACVGSAAIVAIAAADDADDTEKERRNKRRYRNSIDVVGATHNTVQHAIREEQQNNFSSYDFWKGNLLRTTTLNKNEEIGGLVCFRFKPDEKYFAISIRFNEITHVYYYERTGTKK